MEYSTVSQQTCGACEKLFYYNKKDLAFKPVYCTGCLNKIIRLLQSKHYDLEALAKQIRDQ